jgi:hypothetical protein
MRKGSVMMFGLPLGDLGDGGRHGDNLVRIFRGNLHSNIPERKGEV